MTSDGCKAFFYTLKTGTGSSAKDNRIRNIISIEALNTIQIDGGKVLCKWKELLLYVYKKNIKCLSCNKAKDTYCFALFIGTVALQ